MRNKGVICSALFLSIVSATYLPTNADIPNPIEAIRKDTSINVNVKSKKTLWDKYKEKYVLFDPSQLPTDIKPLYSQSDLDLLARLIYAEVGDCSDEKQLLVGNVVLNRVASNKFPNTIEDVIYQKHQYECIYNGKINKLASDQAIKNAKILLEGERICPSNVLFQAEYKLGNGVYKRIDREYFCYG